METVVTDHSVCVKRRMKICSCLLALVLGWNATAEIIHETVEEKTSVSLGCPHSVEGTVTWSRESNGRKVNILTAERDTDTRHIYDPQKRFSSEADKSLFIRRVTVSDSGRYFCNSEAAVELTVIPPGTTRLHATEGTEVTLTCPDVGGSHTKSWSSRNIDEIKHQKGFYASPVDQTLTITSVELKHSGLYYCDGKPAAYLIVTKGQTTTSTATPKTRPTAAATSVPSTTPLTDEDTTTRHKDTTKTATPSTTTRPTTAATSVPSTTPLTDKDTTTTKKRKPKKDRKEKNKDTTKTTTAIIGTTSTTATTSTTGSNTTKDQTLGLVFGIVAFLLLLIIIVVYFAWRRKIKRRGHAEICPIYEEIQDRVVFQPTNGGKGSLAGTTASYCKTDFQDGSHHNDPMYSTIPDLPRVEKKSETSLPNDATYSLISNPLNGGIDKGPSQLPENTYFLLEKPPKHGNNTDHHL